ncbi:hypothetical protein [Lachnoclostridium sp.]|uniref:hypothetical protein n=1 Tax=Lachnoclostridium sp. TaxID=2028282 RepID=UPI0028A12AB0|nr:hypothetical protein [Lachnoclostridium sp.]
MEPRKVISISELVELGWKKDTLLQIARSKNSPAFKTPGGGKWLFDVKKFEKYVDERLAVN